VSLGLKLLLANAVLAGAIVVLAPREIGSTADRVGYEYVAQHPLEPDCPHSIFCYRVLVPTLLENVPVSSVVSWRALAFGTNVLTGLVLARIAMLCGAEAGGVLIVSILFQTSFGATFAVFDPFTPDAVVYLVASLVALCWVRGWPVRALLIGLVGVFAKETVALVMSVPALAVCLSGRPRRRYAWISAAVATWLGLLGFHAVMDLFEGWSERGSASADLLGGAFLARWLSDATLNSSARLLYIFIPFGFAWLYAALGLRHAPERLRVLAFAAVVLLPGLVYVQTVERALATASFVVVPLAALFLARSPILLGLAAALTNGLLTARVGLSTAWLPPVPYLLILAGTLAAVTILREWSDPRARSSVPIGSSVRVISSK